MSKIRMAFKGWGVRSILRGDKFVTRRLVTRANSLVGGIPAPKWAWDMLDWSKAWIDLGPSPAGNPGPYWKVPTTEPDPALRTVHRVYQRHEVGDTLIMCESLYRDGSSVGLARYEDPDGPLALKDRAHVADPWRWKRDTLSPRFMPSALSRATLPLVSVTPSIVQVDMDDAEALREGVTPDEMTTPLEAFVKVWVQIHGEGSWEQMTPCWRYEWTPDGTKLHGNSAVAKGE